MSRAIFDGKLIGEVKTVKFDFTSDLAAGVTISTQSVTAAVWSGTDASPSAIISGSATASGAIVSQLVTGGTLGVTYTLLCSITTSDSQTLRKAAYLSIIPNVV